ncbi:MAG: hypothetical protein QOI13_2448 [Paraburkholderia sp.]|jgi:hypothetical protein|nr:hypothetical protein [Paraburkholderia sp.]
MRPSFATFDTPSRDGYVRLPEQALGHLQLVHIDSGLDEGLLEELRAEDIDAVNAGYTEWQRTQRPGAAHVSVGWDWYLDRASGVLLIASNDVRSNVMCVDQHGIDMGMTHTAQLLLRRLAGLNWPNTVAHAIVPFAWPNIRGRTLQ